MSIFKTILSKIFGGHEQSAAAPTQSPSAPAAEATLDPSTASTVGKSMSAEAGSAFGNASYSTPASLNQPVQIHPSAPSTPVDVAAVMNGLAATNPEKLDWKRSIVDLMKLLDMDSSLASRKQLATELGYSGDSADSAKMNLWLHQQVLKKLSENGGKVPADLLV